MNTFFPTLVAVGVLFFAPVSQALTVQAGCPAPILKPVRSPTRSNVYLVTEGCNLLPIKNPDIYFSHFTSWSEVVFLEDRIIVGIPLAGTFLPWGPYRAYPDGSLLKITTDPTVYVKMGNTIYPFANEQAFLGSGYTFNRVEDVIGVVLKQWSIGAPITVPASAPVPSPAPAPAPAPVPTPAPSNGLYDLGSLPSGFSISWPTAPATSREVSVSNADAFNAAAAVAGTRITVTQSFSGELRISASDIDVVSSGARLDGLTISNGTKRIRIRGGEFSRIFIQSATTYWPSVSTDPALFVEDVLFDGVFVNTPRSGSDFPIIAFDIQGRRIAIIRSRTSAWSYSVWSGALEELPSEDVILAGNEFTSDGPEATVRLVNVRRSATVENRLTNGTPEMSNSKHNYRVHGVSSDALAARNTFVHSGTMNATMEGDRITRLWFLDNVFYQLRPDLFNMDVTRLTSLVATGNTAYSDIHTCFACAGTAAGWDVRENTLLPYRSAP